MRRTPAFGPLQRGGANASQLLPWPLQCVAWPGAILPEVPKAPSKLPLRDRLSWVLGCVALYLIACQLPLFGPRDLTLDPIGHYRIVLASRRGTMLDLGLLPLLTAYLVVYFLNYFDVVNVKKTDPRGLTTLRSSLAMAAAAVQGFLLLLNGAYANPSQGPPLSYVRSLLVIVQLELAAVLLNYLDEVLLAGYGVAASGDSAGALSLFATVNVCGAFVMAAFSPFRNGDAFEGAILSFLHSLLFRRSNKLRGLASALFRLNAPSVFSLLVAVSVFAAINYLKCYRIELTLNSSRARGISAVYPVRLFTVAAIPLLLFAATLANLDILKGVISCFIPSFFSSLLPDMLAKLLAMVLHVLVVPVAVFMTVHLWLDTSEQAPEEIAGMLKGQGVVVKGYRGTGITQLLTRLVEPSVDFGATVAAALVLVSEVMGAKPAGIGILVAVCTFHGYYELFGRERAKTNIMNG